MYNYIFFIIFGILIFLLWNNYNSFSVGIPTANIYESGGNYALYTGQPPDGSGNLIRQEELTTRQIEYLKPHINSPDFNEFIGVDDNSLIEYIQYLRNQEYTERIREINPNLVADTNNLAELLQQIQNNLDESERLLAYALVLTRCAVDSSLTNLDFNTFEMIGRYNREELTGGTFNNDDLFAIIGVINGILTETPRTPNNQINIINFYKLIKFMIKLLKFGVSIDKIIHVLINLPDFLQNDYLITDTWIENLYMYIYIYANSTVESFTLFNNILGDFNMSNRRGIMACDATIFRKFKSISKFEGDRNNL